MKKKRKEKDRKEEDRILNNLATQTKKVSMDEDRLILYDGIESPEV